MLVDDNFIIIIKGPFFFLFFRKFNLLQKDGISCFFGKSFLIRINIINLCFCVDHVKLAFGQTGNRIFFQNCIKLIVEYPSANITNRGFAICVKNRNIHGKT